MEKNKPTTIFKTNIEIKVDAIHDIMVVCMIPPLDMKVLTKFSMLDTRTEDLSILRAELGKDLKRMAEEIVEGPFLEEALQKFKEFKEKESETNDG